MSTIVFMHVGSDTQQATVMVRSFRSHNPEAQIIQVADMDSPAIEGADEVARWPMPDDNIMLFRMRCFAALPTSDRAWFLDTDMLCHRPLTYLGEGRPQAAVCLRQANGPIKPTFYQGVDILAQYAGKTAMEVYPYLGCATMVDDCDFWSACLTQMENLDPKFHRWFGDQEALRDVVSRGDYNVGRLPDGIYACPPERMNASTAMITHYKGKRKHLMMVRAAQDGIL